MADALIEVAPAEEPSSIVLAQNTLVCIPEPVRETTEATETIELPAIVSDPNSDFSGIPTDASSGNASFSSTPPTILTDAASIASEPSKPDLAAVLTALEDPVERIEQTVEVGSPHRDLPTPQPPAPEDKENLTPRRARAARSATGTPIYNLAKLAGTYIHGKRRANGDEVREKRRRTAPANAFGANSNASIDSVVQHGIEALDMDWSLSAPSTPKSARADATSKTTAKGKKEKAAPVVGTRRATRASLATEAVVAAASSLGKRSRKAVEKIPRELRRLQDTNEFVGIEAKPVLHTIWSNGHYIDPNDLNDDGEPVRKRARKNAAQPKHQAEAQAEEAETSKEATPTISTKRKRVKKWLDKGLYAGQDAPLDYTAGLSTADKKKLALYPELRPSGKVNKTLPLPMFAGLRTLINGRDFKLPFDVCNPLPPGQPKPDEWRKMTKSMRPRSASYIMVTC